MQKKLADKLINECTKTIGKMKLFNVIKIIMSIIPAKFVLY